MEPFYQKRVQNLPKSTLSFGRFFSAFLPHALVENGAEKAGNVTKTHSKRENTLNTRIHVWILGR